MAVAKYKKRFFDVEIPLINKETQLIGYEISELDGKFMKYDLTRILKGKGIILDLQVKVEKETATSLPKGLNTVPYYIRRIIRKGTDYVEDSFKVDCKDAELIIKPIMVTRRKVSRSLRKSLREKTKEEIQNYVKTLTYDEIFKDILRNKLQKEISLKMKKIYPLSAFEVRTLKVQKVLEKAKE
jgi:ribosomal protein S3AE